nr:MAG TPA: hypothetical protein [Bacteriophage sp.]
MLLSTPFSCISFSSFSVLSQFRKFFIIYCTRKFDNQALIS